MMLMMFIFSLWNNVIFKQISCIWINKDTLCKDIKQYLRCKIGRTDQNIRYLMVNIWFFYWAISSLFVNIDAHIWKSVKHRSEYAAVLFENAFSQLDWYLVARVHFISWLICIINNKYAPTHNLHRINMDNVFWEELKKSRVEKNDPRVDSGKSARTSSCPFYHF